jgi:hypothetical protein
MLLSHTGAANERSGHTQPRLMSLFQPTLYPAGITYPVQINDLALSS